VSLNVKIDTFEGPFDLLFHLIEKNQIDIYNIPIAELTEQYLNYIDEISEDQLDSASEFLLMAAILLNIKSKMLLPKPKEEHVSELAASEDDNADPRSELMNKLIEYKKFKEISLILKQKEQEQELVLKKPPEDLSSIWANEIELANITFEDIKLAYKSVINKEKPQKVVSKIQKDPIPLSRKIIEVYKLLKRKSKLFFSRLCNNKSSKLEMITTFLAVLELVKMRRIYAVQEKQFEEIVLTYREV